MSNSYRSEDVQEILQRALARQQSAEYSRRHLILYGDNEERGLKSLLTRGI